MVNTHRLSSALWTLSPVSAFAKIGLNTWVHVQLAQTRKSHNQYALGNKCTLFVDLFVLFLTFGNHWFNPYFSVRLSLKGKSTIHGCPINVDGS